MNKEGLNYSEMVELKNLWARSNRTQKSLIMREVPLRAKPLQETHPFQKNQSNPINSHKSEELHTKTQSP